MSTSLVQRGVQNGHNTPDVASAVLRRVPAGNALLNAAQGNIHLLCCKGTFLAHVNTFQAFLIAAFSTYFFSYLDNWKKAFIFLLLKIKRYQENYEA